MPDRKAELPSIKSERQKIDSMLQPPLFERVIQ